MCVCVCVCVCQRKTKDRADGVCLCALYDLCACVHAYVRAYVHSCVMRNFGLQNNLENPVSNQCN